jgi:cell division protein FtsB
MDLKQQILVALGLDKQEESEELSSEKEKLSAQVVELSNEPAAKPVDTNKFSALGRETSQRDLSKMSKRERILYNITNK